MPHYIPIRFGAAWLALPAGLVVQILGQIRWMRLPSAPAAWPGVAAWRGRAMAVLDLSSLLPQPPLIASSPRARTVVAQVQGSLLAIPVDEAQEALLAEQSAVKPSHVTSFRHSLGELPLKDQIVPVFDLAELMAETLASRESGAAR